MPNERVPQMDWAFPNQSDVFKMFRQRLELYFKVKGIKNDDQVNHVLLQVGDEGLRRYNSWTLTDDERKSASTIFDKFAEQLEPSENYRVSRLRLMHYRQKPEETLDDFVNRCKLQALRCQFKDNEIHERIIELIVASTPISDFQKELLGKDDKYKLDEALVLGRTYEAAASHVQQIKDMNTPSTVIHGVSKRGGGNCLNCGLKHPRNQCPAYGAECTACGKSNHWAKVCLSSKQKWKRSPSRERGRSYSKYQGDNPHSRPRSKTPYKHNKGDKHNRMQTDAIQHEQFSDDYAVDEQFELLSFGNITVSSMCLQKTRRDEAFAALNIKIYNRPGIHNLRLKVDTGAQGNTIPLSVFRRMYPDMLTTDGYPVPEVSTASRRAR
jgi:hypothetical protein